MFYAKEKIAILPDSVSSTSRKISIHNITTCKNITVIRLDKIITIAKIKIIIIAKIKAHPPADGTDHNGAKSRSLAPRTRPAEYAIKPNASVHHHHHLLLHYHHHY